MLTAPTLHQALLADGITHVAGSINTGRRVLIGLGGEPLGSYTAHEAWAVINDRGALGLTAAFRAAYAAQQKATA